jgi:ribonuclease BN (tRNA processing enzyme)
MKLIFLGTNGWYDTDEGNTVSVLIDTEKFVVVLDAGFGLYKLGKYISAEKPVYLFLSHLHLDHICGLHTLSGLNLKNLEIFCQKGMKKHLDVFINHPFTIPLSGLAYPAKITEIEPGKHTHPFEFECRPLHHADPCMGYRLFLDKKTIAYCTDTNICENDMMLASHADLLIHECALLPGEESPSWGHSNSEETARLAKDAGAKKLILTHLAVKPYADEKTRKKTEEDARKIFPETTMASDGLVVEI